jgi:hypothetical protein
MCSTHDPWPTVPIGHVICKLRCLAAPQGKTPLLPCICASPCIPPLTNAVTSAFPAVSLHLLSVSAKYTWPGPSNARNLLLAGHLNCPSTWTKWCPISTLTLLCIFYPLYCMILSLQKHSKLICLCYWRIPSCSWEKNCSRRKCRYALCSTSAGLRPEKNYPIPCLFIMGCIPTKTPSDVQSSGSESSSIRRPLHVLRMSCFMNASGPNLILSVRRRSCHRAAFITVTHWLWTCIWVSTLSGFPITRLTRRFHIRCHATDTIYILFGPIRLQEKHAGSSRDVWKLLGARPGHRMLHAVWSDWPSRPTWFKSGPHAGRCEAGG